MNEKAYYESVNTKNELKLRELQKELPPFCREFFIGMKASVSSRTLLAYAYDLGIFFDFIHQNNPICAKKPVNEFTIDLLDQISPMDIEEYLDYLRVYEKMVLRIPMMKEAFHVNWQAYEAFIITISVKK